LNRIINFKNNKILVSVSALLILLLIIFVLFYLKSNHKNNKIILSKLDKIELALSPNQKARGLMYRKNLCSSCAMLFVYDENLPSRDSFWMQNTYISLDMIFLDKNGQVVSLFEYTKPLDNSIKYTPSSEYNYVIETNAGFVKAHKLHMGNMIDTDYLFSKGVGYGN